jgi:hypothetical protein
MKKIIILLVIAVCLIFKPVLFAAGFGDFATNIISAPTLIVSYNSMAGLYNLIDEKSGGIRTSSAPEGTFFPSDKNIDPGFEGRFEKNLNNQASALVGTTVDVFRNEDFSVSLNVLFGIGKQTVRLETSYDNAIGGAYGATADASVTVQAHDIIAPSLNMVYNPIPWMFFTIGSRITDYKITIEEKRWFYQAAGQSAGSARTATSPLNTELSVEGTLFFVEPGIGLIWRKENSRTAIFASAKWITAVNTDTFISDYRVEIGATLDLK